MKYKIMVVLMFLLFASFASGHIDSIKEEAVPVKMTAGNDYTLVYSFVNTHDSRQEFLPVINISYPNQFMGELKVSSNYSSIALDCNESSAGVFECGYNSSLIKALSGKSFIRYRITPRIDFKPENVSITLTMFGNNVPEPVAGQPSSSSSGGSRNGGSGNAYNSFSSGSKMVSLGYGDALVFSINNHRHTAVLTKIGKNYVILRVSSTPQDKTIPLGNSVYYDTDGNGKDDLRVFLSSINPFGSSYKANLNFVILDEDSELPKSGGGQGGGNSILKVNDTTHTVGGTDTIPRPKDNTTEESPKRDYRMVTLLVLALVLIVVMVIGLIKYHNTKEGMKR